MADVTSPTDNDNVPPQITSPTSLAVSQTLDRDRLSEHSTSSDRRPSSDRDTFSVGPLESRSSSSSKLVGGISRAFSRRGGSESMGPMDDPSIRHTTTAVNMKKDKSRLSGIFRETVPFLSRETIAAIPEGTPIDCEGYLTKKGHVVTNWKMRYFVLRGQILQYFADENAAHGGGRILGQVVLERVAPWSGESHGFMFFTSKKIPYYVYAASEVERTKWMDALKDYIVQPEPVDCEGYLTKRGHLVPTYRLRYFVLRGTCLKYYTDEESCRANGTAIAEVEVKSVAPWDGEDTGIMFKTATGHMFYVYADTMKDQMKWLNCLKRVVSVPEPVACAGYLTKQGHKRKSWKKRYFVLRGTMLTYYPDYDSANTGGKPISQINIEDVQKWDGEPFGFMFMTTDQIPYYVYADNDRERSKWMSALRTSAGVIPDESSKKCPRCNATLTGSRFCGACGFKIRATIGDAVDIQDSNAIKTDEVGLDGDEPIEDSPFDELEALSEGARTLLLAVMQTPEGVDVGDATPFPIRSSQRKIHSLDHISETNSSSTNDVNDVSIEIKKEVTSELSESVDSERQNTLLSTPSGNNPVTESGNVVMNESKESQPYQERITEPHETSQELSPKPDTDIQTEEVDTELQDSVYDVQLDTRGILGFDEPVKKEPAKIVQTTRNLDEDTKKMDLYTHIERELEFSPLFVPSKDSPVRCRYYGSINYETSRKVLVFLNDSGPLGLWRQDQSMLPLTVDHPWSMAQYFTRAIEEGYSVVVCNPFSNNAKVFEEGGRERVVPIPESSTPKEHVEFVWQNCLLKCSGDISFIAYARGGALVKALLQSKEADAKQNIKRIAFIDSKHVIDGSESPGVLELLGRRSINWELATEVLGGQIVNSQTRVGCVCLSAGGSPRQEATPEVIEKAENSVFAFLGANPERPGMTAVVGVIRSALRKLSRQANQNKSNVVVLGESAASDFSNDSYESNVAPKKIVKSSRVVSEEKKSAPKPSNVPKPSSPYFKPNKTNSHPNSAPKSSSQISLSDFELNKVVGQGGFGKVFLAKKVTDPGSGRYFAVKVLKKKQVMSNGLVNTTMAERHILTEVSHPFVVKLHYAFQSENKLYLVMDYLSGGSLSVHLRRKRRFPEEWAKFYAAEIAAAMAHLHSVNIIYRDAKLENVMMDHTGHVRITDFGLSKVGVSGVQDATTFCGTAAYIPPELLKGNAYGKAADWWSFGILLFEMIAGKPPFYHRNRETMFQIILKQEWVTFTPAFSDSAVSLIRGLLTKHPMKRLGSGSRGADEILSHPFFRDIDWDALLAKKVKPPFNPGVGEIDTLYAPRHINEITPRDREASILVPSNRPNDFDGFSFVGRSPELDNEKST